MAVMQMERIRLCAMKRDRKAILELLQRRGVVEVRDGGEADEVFTKADMSSTKRLFEKNAETAEKALEILKKYYDGKAPGLAFLRGREAVELKVNDQFVSVRDNVQKVAYNVVQLDKDIAECRAEILRLQAQLEALVPWLDLPFSPAFSGTKKTAAFVGGIDGEHDEAALLAKLAEAAPNLEKLHLEIVHKSRPQTFFYLIVLKQDAALAEEALRVMGFTRPSSPSRLLPQQQKKNLEAKIAEAEVSITKAEEELKDYTARMDDLRFLQDHMNMRAEKYGVIQSLRQSKHVFVLDGFIPSKCSPELQKELTDRFECSVDVEHAPADDDVPVILENNAFVAPGETVLESYSLPGKTDIDPTSVMSIFYYIMFGLMFSDAGYGLIMVVLCGFALLKFKNMEPSWKKNISLFFWCGVSTMFWGIMFSSYFGDLVQVVASTFFGRTVVINPVWLDPLKEPMILLLACLAIGIVHLSAGMILKGVTYARNGMKKDIIYDVVFPLAIVYALVAILMGTELFENMAGFMINFPSWGGTVLGAIAAIGAIGVVLFGGRESKNWFKRLLKGAYALYNVFAGWLGDILSYSRLLALGLATGVIASVMNTLGAMPAGGGTNVIVGAVFFVVVFAIGHGMNFGINVLGAYVHSNRLEFVEFFGKFYEGGGVKFAPFGMHTKYYKIQEETQNG